MAVVIKTLQTPGGKYVYDRATHKKLRVNDDEYASFLRIEAGTVSESDEIVLKRYQDQGYCTDSEIEEIRHPASTLLQYRLDSRVAQLTMQITQDCNLRCSYCAYSGAYENQRSHSKKTMSVKTMKKCVDFLMERSREISEVVIGIYGGEPLLEIDKMQECIDYINEKYTNRGIRYTLTTNGTLFDEDAIRILENNNFDVNISFDGPEELHDANRVYADGRGSFNDIMNRIEYIRENHPKLFSKISFLSVIAPGVDYACVNNFFVATDVIESRTAAVNTVSQYSAKESVVYDDLYYTTYTYQSMKHLLAAVGLYDKSKTSKLFGTYIGGVKRFYEGMAKNSRLLKTAHPGGPCVPGVMRPFVAVDGSIYPCERVSEGSDAMKIGHIDTGFDLQKADELLNVGKLTAEECKNCWAFRECVLCCAASDGGDELSRELRLSRCVDSTNSMLENLKATCLLQEYGCDMSSL